MKTMMTLAVLMVAGTAFAQDFQAQPRPGSYSGNGQPSVRTAPRIDPRVEQIARAYRGQADKLRQVCMRLCNEWIYLDEAGSPRAYAAYQNYIAHKRAFDLLRYGR